MKMNAIVNRVVVEARATGFDQTTASVKQLDNAVDGLRVANDRTAKSTLDVTPALDRLRRSMDAEYRAAQQLAAGQRTLTLAHQTGLISAVQQERIFAQLQARYGTAGAAAGRLAAANDNLARSSSATAASATGLTTAIAGLAGIAATAAAALAVYGVAILAIGTSAAQTGIQMQALERSFAAAAGSALQGGREFTFVKAESERLGLAFGETAKQYAQLVAASRDSTLQGQATRDIFIAVSQAMTALGKSSDETGGALLAIQQMMSKGTVSAEEIRQQLGERLPGAFNLAAAAMGKTTAEFGKMLEDGDVLATELIPKLSVELNKFYRASAAAASNDLGANINRLKNAWQEYQAAVAGGGLNDSLNRAAQALTTFLRDSDSGASTGRRLGDAINAIVTALERVPRGAENFGILAQMAREALSAFGAWIESFTALQGVAVETGASVGDSFSAVVGYVQTAINGVIGIAVGGYQMVTAAWQGLPSVFAEIATNAGNALINGIAAAVNYVIGLLNSMIGSINGIGAKLPDAIGFKPIEEIASVTFRNIENTAAGSASRIGASLSEIGKEAASKNYLGEFGKSVSDAVDGQISRFRELRSAQDASNHLLREAGKIAKESEVADTYKNAAAAGKAAKEAADESGGAAKGAASAYENLIQRTKDRIEELQLEAQYASKTATEVIKLKLAHDLERAAKKDGTEVTEEMRKEWDKLGGELADATQHLERVRKAQNDLKKAQDAVADSFASFVEDVLTGSDGIEGALKSLGKTFLANSIDALISGKGPLAGAAGLASPTRDGQGGILGLLTGNLKPFSDAVAKGTAKGSAEGFETGWHRAAANDNSSFFGNINSKDLAGGLTAIAGLAGSYGSGMAAGSYAQAGIGGALSGGMAGLSLAGTSIGASLGGASVLGPVGAAIGIGLAIYGQQQARKQQKKEQRRQAYEAYQEAAPQIAQLGSQMRGDPQGTIAQRFEEARASTQKLGDIAVVAGRRDEAIKLFEDLATYRARVIDEFKAGYGGMIAAFSDGTGPNSPFATARDQVKSLGDQLKVFIDDTKTVYGDSAPEVERARQAARDYALSVLDGARQMSVAATRMEEIRGASAGLQQVLVDLGMSAEAAAAAINEKATAALDRLKVAFRDELVVKVNEVEGVGYINEIENLFKEAASRRNDASLLGTLEKDGPLIERWLRGASQQVVDSARLTGEAFDRLLGALPFVADYVHEFQEELDATAKAADIAARKLAYQDRLFAALNDTSTLEGQLAAFDRTALRDREAEIKAGGEAILDLEAAQAAERFKIIKEYNQKAIDDQKAALREAETFLASFTRNIQQYLDGLRAGSDSPLSPQARLQAAQSQYAAQLALAQGGNRDALNGITGYASDLLDAAKAYYASSSGFQGIFAQIQSQLAALPNQVSAEQLIVNAINASRDALLLKMNELDTNGDGMISKQEAANTWLSSIFKELDINGDAQLSKFEQLLYADGVTRAQLKAAIESGPSGTANVLASYFNAIDRNTSQSIDFGEMQSALKGMASDSQLRDMFTRLDTDNSGSISRLEAIKGATDGTRNGVARNVNDQDATLTAIQSLLGTIKELSRTTDIYIATVRDNTTAQASTLTSINALTSSQNAVLAVANTSAAQQEFFLNKVWENLRSANSRYFADGNSLPTPQYAEGGYVSGPGTGTSDSIAARLSNGEFVFRKAAVDRFGVGMLDQMNDNFRMPAMPVPVMGGGDMRAVVAELKALRAELAAHKAATVKATVAAAEHVGDEVKLVAAVQSDAAREMRNKAA